jgi:hypothetical protein
MGLIDIMVLALPLVAVLGGLILMTRWMAKRRDES